MLQWTQQALANKAGVSEASVVDFEKERRQVSADLLAKIGRTLEEAGIELIENGKGPGVRMKSQGR